MFLVPSIMKLLGSDCWWAPRWMKRLQKLIGLAEFDATDERKPFGAPARLEDELIFGEVVTAGWPTPPRESSASEASAPPAVMTKPMPTAVMDRDDEPFATETSTTTDGVIDTDTEEAATELPADGAELSTTPRDDG